MVPQLGQGFLQPKGREVTGKPQRWQAGAVSSRANARDLALEWFERGREAAGERLITAVLAERSKGFD